jgi:ABC-2 type transport system permease protein
MRKYLALGRLVLLDQLEYPAEFLYFLFLNAFPLFVMTYLWLAVYQSAQTIAGFDLNTIITYFFLSFVVGRLNSDTAFYFADLIREGDLTSYLLKPMVFIRYMFVHMVFRKIITFLISSPVIIIIFILLRNHFIQPPDLLTFLLFLVSVTLAMLMYALAGYLIGLFAFWTGDISGIYYFYYALIGFLSGSVLPLSFFPAWLQQIINWLPFRYFIAFPINIYLGKYTPLQILSNLAIGLIWFFLLYLIYRLIWKRGLRIYSGYGN